MRDSPPLPSCYTSSSSIKETRHPSQLLCCIFCSGSSLRFSTKSENCSSDLGHPLHFLPSSQGFQRSAFSPVSLFLSPDPRLCTTISEANLPFRTTRSVLRVYCVTEVNELENLHCNAGKRVMDTPSQPQLTPILFSRWQAGEPASLLGVQKPESQSNLWTVSITPGNPLLGKSMQLEITN